MRGVGGSGGGGARRGGNFCDRRCFFGVTGERGGVDGGLLLLLAGFFASRVYFRRCHVCRSKHEALPIAGMGEREEGLSGSGLSVWLSCAGVVLERYLVLVYPTGRS